jgi:hypothetical protein
MIANLAPSGSYNWADVDALGGLPVVMKVRCPLVHSHHVLTLSRWW